MRVLWEDGNVKLSLSYLDTLPFLHVEINKLTKDLYKKYLVEFVKVVRGEGLEVVYSSCTSPKARKLNEMFGFEYICDVAGHEIMEYRKWL